MGPNFGDVGDKSSRFAAILGTDQYILDEDGTTPFGGTRAVFLIQMSSKSIDIIETISRLCRSAMLWASRPADVKERVGTMMRTAPRKAISFSVALAGILFLRAPAGAVDPPGGSPPSPDAARRPERRSAIRGAGTEAAGSAAAGAHQRAGAATGSY